MPRRSDPYGSPFPGSGLFDPWGRRPRRSADPRVELERRRRAEMEARRRQAMLREQQERRRALERRRELDEQRRRTEILEARRREQEEARLRDALEQNSEQHRGRWEDGGPLDPRESGPDDDIAATTEAPRHDVPRFSGGRPEAGSAMDLPADEPSAVHRTQAARPAEALPAEARPADEVEIAGEATYGSARGATLDESTEIERVRARLERSAQRETEAQRRAVLIDMLEVLDDLDRALDAGEDDAPLTEGVALVRDNFLRKLERHGVTRGDDVRGMAFDPERHTAIGTAPVSADLDGTLVEVLGPAYFVGDELLRAAQVIVGRG